MSNSIRISFEPVKTLGFAGIGDDYNPVVDSSGNQQFLHPCRQLLIQNFTNADLMVSDIGTTSGLADKFPIAAGASMIFDITSNKTVPQGCFLPECMRLFVKNLVAGSSPNSGAVYVTVFYGEDA
jgi:hypothetical protein